MRRSFLLLGSTAILVPSAANAADQLKFGKEPAWVVPQTIPAAPAKGEERPIALLLHDQQTFLEPGKVSNYSEIAFKIQKPEGLAAGNLSVSWDPATDSVTINRLEIRRGSQVIDVLGSGQTFTTMRRESNLDLAMLDGMLTANIQPEGLQQGDIVVLASTTDHVDPVLKDHVEATFAPWSDAQIALGHASLSWPSNIDVRLQKTGDLATPRQEVRDGRRIYDLTIRDIEPVIGPKGAPARFQIGRMGEATDFRSWADAARLLMPLYHDAAVVPPSGSLRDEVEKIRKTSGDPKARAAQALQLVQQRIRYVALLMGEGGLVPASAEATWSRRFGDCKAKTALLLGILHELGIEAEPIAVNPIIGDAIADRLPMIGLFNHVLVRAHVGGRIYYLDGTRSGDSALDDIEVPDFGWGLPLVENAQLVQLVPSPLSSPKSETTIAIDASAGIYTPAGISAEQIVRGDLAIALNSGLSSLTDAQRKQYFEEYWKKSINDDVSSEASSFAFDKSSRELRLSMKGKMKVDWSGGYFHLPQSSVGYTPDVDRTEGPLHDAPFAVDYPAFARTETTVRFPPQFFPADIAKLVPDPVHTTLIGVEYSRTEAASRDAMTVQTTTRSVAPEVSYKDAIAQSAKLKALADGDVSIRLPTAYRATPADLIALAQVEPSSSKEYFERGLRFLTARKFDQAIADFTKAHELEPSDVWPLANRGITHAWKNEIDLAQADLDAVQAKQPDNSVMLRARGLIAEQKNDCATAVEFYSKSLTVDPSNPFARGRRATCEASLSKNQEALADSALALKADPSWIELRVLRANIFVRLGNNDDVIKEAQLLTSENPKSAYAYVAAGKIYARLKRSADVKKAFDQALALESSAFVYVNRAQSKPFADRAGRMADLDAALKIEPNNADALAEKAEQMAADGDLKGARAVYDHVATINSDSDQIKLRRAILMFKTGDVAEARKVFAGLRAKAKSATELNSLCWAKATAGILLDVALEECGEALKREPDAGPYLDSVALVELRLGKVDSAIADYTRAISKNSGAASFMGRALAYAQKGDRPSADADLARALQLDPDSQTRFAEFGLKLDERTHEAARQAPGN